MSSDWDTSWPKKLLDDATAKLEEKRGTKPPPPLIQNVPSILQEDEELKKYYRPKMFSFGPIHHGKFQASEHLKLKLAGHFIKVNDIKNPGELLQKINDKLIHLKSCYHKQALTSSESQYVKDNDEGLAGIFFVDGCAIVHFIYCFVHDAKEEDSQKKYLKILEIKKDQVAFARHDIFLLENQLPYLLLELVIDSLGVKGKDYKDSITEFVSRNQMVKAPSQSKGEQTAEGTNLQEIKININRPPCHLLDLLRRGLIGEPKNEEGFSTWIWKKLSRLSCKIWRKTAERIQDWQSFRSVNELQASGIWLKPCIGISLKNISFQGFCGVGFLKLPRLLVDDSTAPKLYNLIAYEMCPDFVNDFEVISYVCFLDILIDEPGDVRELRKANILLNALGSDQDVAKLFNEIARYLAYNPDIYEDVTTRIENYCNSKIMTWTAQFLHDHFRSPWTFLAFLGALAALALSVLQTFPSLNPSQKG